MQTPFTQGVRLFDCENMQACAQGEQEKNIWSRKYNDLNNYVVESNMSVLQYRRNDNSVWYTIVICKSSTYVIMYGESELWNNEGDYLCAC